MGKRGGGAGKSAGARTPYTLHAVASMARKLPSDVDVTYRTLVRLTRAYKILKEAIVAMKNTHVGAALASLLAELRKKAVPDPENDPGAPKLCAALESHRMPEVPKGAVMQLLEMAQQAGAPDVRETVAAVLNGRRRLEGDAKLFVTFNPGDEYTGYAQTLTQLGMPDVVPVLANHLAHTKKTKKPASDSDNESEDEALESDE